MMKDLFICLLLNICKFGRLKSADMYNDNFSTLDIVTEDGKYSISIRKEETVEEEGK